MQKFETYEIVFVFGSGKILQIDGSYFHYWGNVEFFEKFSWFCKNFLGFGSVFSDDFSKTWSDLNLFLEVAIFKQSQKDISDLIIRLSIHDIIPVSVSNLDLLNLWRGLLDTFLKLKKILIIFLAHWVVAYRVDYNLKETQSFGALK